MVSTPFTTVEHLIRMVDKGTNLEAIFGKDEVVRLYKKALMTLHPDVCDHPKAADAFIRLTAMKEEYDRRNILKDDAGNFESNGDHAIFKGDKEWLEKSYETYRKLKDKRGPAAKYFHNYLPWGMSFSTQLKVDFKYRSLPLSRLVLPQKHVLWILSRMLEGCAYFSEMGWTHGGINPESIYVVPETHGIIFASFYHSQKKGHKISSASASYKHWYPSETFDKKRARPLIDTEMAKRTAAYLLGDPSGMGIRLRKDIHPALMEFLLQRHKDAFTCFDEYRRMLKGNFKRKFNELNI